MVDKARKDFMSWLELMAALSPWNDVGDPSAQPFIDAFSAARAMALVAASAYVEAVRASPDRDLKSWLGDMATLKRWVNVGNSESQPFFDAFSAARARALAAAAEAARGG
jgi:hypothetical protein